MDGIKIEVDTSKVQENPNAIGMEEQVTSKLHDENKALPLADGEQKKNSRGKERMGSKGKQRKSIKLRENVPNENEVVVPSSKKVDDEADNENDELKKKILELTFSRDTEEVGIFPFV